MPPLGLSPPPVQWVPGLTLGGKEAGAWRCSPTPSVEIKERVPIPIPLLPLWAFMACYRVEFISSNNKREKKLYRSNSTLVTCWKEQRMRYHLKHKNERNLSLAYSIGLLHCSQYCELIQELMNGAGAWC